MTTYVGNGGEIDAEGYFKLWSAMFTQGYAPRTAGAWQVTASSGMDVSVGAGAGWIEYATSYGYPAWLSAAETVSIPAADASNPRNDIVVGYIDRAAIAANPQDGTEINNPGAMDLTVVSGTAAGSPTDPADATIQAAVGASNPYIKLARVVTPAAAVAITNPDITNLVEESTLRSLEDLTGHLDVARRTSNISVTTSWTTLITTTVTIPTTDKKIVIEASGGYFDSDNVSNEHSLETRITVAGTQIAGNLQGRNANEVHALNLRKVTDTATIGTGSKVIALQASATAASTFVGAASATAPMELHIYLV